MGEDERQRVEKVRGSRRARLTRVEGTLNDSDAEATLRDDDEEQRPVDRNDPLRREKPPHY
ncbi:hypothetical protein GCM10010915_12240 [Microbacterium faecale]|uniref:Uncharacterized protein n=1 Tax=Microbacterium faecale TaxID=1804630 RepID=A0A916Y8D3_9MICO|nr:hypothetical protein [Microbacterium faecale]GGD33411.1 hypothetical protein GCM10010915_12240 [Microbacterium faecale]